MSIPDCQLDEPDVRMRWCGLHELSYIKTCEQCANDEADRRFDSQREERGRA